MLGALSSKSGCPKSPSGCRFSSRTLLTLSIPYTTAIPATPLQLLLPDSNDTWPASDRSLRSFLQFAAQPARDTTRSRASRSAIDRAFIRTYIIVDDPRTASEARERPVRLHLMPLVRPVRSSSPRSDHHDSQRTPSVSHHEAAFTGRTLYCRVLCNIRSTPRGGTGRVHTGWTCAKSQPALTSTARDTLLTVHLLAGP